MSINYEAFKNALAKNISVPAMIDFNNGNEELLNEIISDILKELDTDKICPICGRELYKSDLENFDYVCPNCDERFNAKEVHDNDINCNYYVLEFRINNDPTHTNSMCVLGYRKPTIEEAKEFWKADCEMYGDEYLDDIYGISREEAYSSYDMKNAHKWPVFGKEKKTMMYCHCCCTPFTEEDAKRDVKKARRTGMDVENYICPICWADESVITKIDN